MQLTPHTPECASGRATQFASGRATQFTGRFEAAPRLSWVRVLPRQPLRGLNISASRVKQSGTAVVGLITSLAAHLFDPNTG